MKDTTKDATWKVKYLIEADITEVIEILTSILFKQLNYQINNKVFLRFRNILRTIKILYIKLFWL